MGKSIPNDHPLYDLFFTTVQESIDCHVSSGGEEQISAYLADLLVSFIHTDRVFAVKNSDGVPVVSVSEMLAEGDIRANADSFERERQVHQHIGDFILFWSGIYPQFLRQLRLRIGQDLLCDYPRQGRESYQLVSEYEKTAMRPAAATFAKLSDGFEDYAFCLRVVRDRLRLAPWTEA